MAKLRGRGRKRKSEKTVKHKAETYKKRHLCLIDFIRILVAMSANTVSVSSEFDIFASKPIQTFVRETTEVK